MLHMSRVQWNNRTGQRQTTASPAVLRTPALQSYSRAEWLARNRPVPAQLSSQPRTAPITRRSTLISISRADWLARFRTLANAEPASHTLGPPKPPAAPIERRPAITSISRAAWLSRHASCAVTTAQPVAQILGSRRAARHMPAKPSAPIPKHQRSGLCILPSPVTPHHVFVHAPPAFHGHERSTTAFDVIVACEAICADDPRVCGKKAGRAALAANTFISTTVRDDVLRRWEMLKLLRLLPQETLCRLSGLSMSAFKLRSPIDIAHFLFGKARSVAAPTITQARHSLSRLLKYMALRHIPFDGSFGQLPDIDLYGFLISVHLEAVANGSAKRPGFTAVWSVFDGLTYLVRHFQFMLPTAAVHNSLPRRGNKTGAGAILTGALPLPPEALQLVCDYAAHPDTPPVLASYAYALIVSTVGSLRQINTQHICYYGVIWINGKSYLLAQHLDGKSRDKSPTVFIIPLEDTRSSRKWFDANQNRLPVGCGFLWCECEGDAASPTATLLPCPLDDAKIMSAIRLVLQKACGMSASMAACFSKHSMRKTMVCVAQSAGCPWEQCLELGHWGNCSLDNSFLLPAEDISRKHALDILQMPKRYSANARIARVARIASNQITRMQQYLRHPRVLARAKHDWDVKWELMSQYEHAIEGA